METKFKILGGVLGIIFIAWLGIFAYNKYWKKSGGATLSPNPPADQLPYNISKEEEKKLKTLANNFVIRYRSYVLGDFSGLEKLKDQMAPELWREKSQWMEGEKQKLAGQSRRYITFSAFPEKSDIVSYYKDRAEVEVSYLARETKGTTIQKETTIYIDEFGQEGKPVPPSVETRKKIRLRFAKENNEWKVSKIEDIK